MDTLSILKAEYNTDAWTRIRRYMEHLVQLLYVYYVLRFEKTFSIGDLPVSDEDFDFIALLLSTHDCYKPLAEPNHAALGAQQMEDGEHRACMRFHSDLATQHTGESPLRALVPLLTYLKTNPDPSRFLHRLRVLTIIDVAAYGFLNQSRIRSYEYLVQLLRNVPDARQFAEIERDDTRSRVRRLLEANNRVIIDDAVINETWDQFEHRTALENLLPEVSFDYGIYAFEPLFRRLALGGNSFLLEDRSVLTLTATSPALNASLQCIYDVLTGDPLLDGIVTTTEETVDGRCLRTIHMHGLAPSKSNDTATFLAWAERYQPLV